MTRAPHLLLGALAGLALAAAHPPLGVALLALLVPGLLVAAVDMAFAAGTRWWTAPALAAVVGHGLLLAWVVLPAGTIGWALLVLVQAAWWTLFAAVVRGLPTTRVRPLLVGIAWVGVDAVRGVLPLNGFAWGTLGAAGVDLPWLAPLARLAGEKAITLAVVVLSVAAWEALRLPLEATRDDDGCLRWPRLRDTLPAGTVGAAWLGAAALVVTLATVEPPAPTGEADVLVVQPNGFETFDGTLAELDVAIAEQAVALTAASVAADGPPDLTVWPESTLDADPGRAPALAAALRAGGRLTGGRLLAGTILDGDAPRTFRNVLQAVDADGAARVAYQKRRLVPFGEYVPFRAALDWFPPLRQVPRDAVPGDGPELAAVGDLRIGVAICFETLFGWLVRQNLLAPGGPGDLVVAATNDASFGRGGEAAQHLAQSRLRALETGRWVIHAGVSGTSAFVDPDGRVHDATDLFEATTLRRTITTTIGRTPFLVTGDWLGPATMAGLAALGLLGRGAAADPAPPPTPETPVADALVVIPTYNEHATLAEVVSRVLAAPVDVDVLVVDDASPDGTGQLADRLAADDGRVHVLHRAAKEGLGPAYRAGLGWGMEAGYDVLVEMDADLSHDPGHLPELLAGTQRADLVLGSRYVPGGGTRNWPWHRRALSSGGNRYVRAVTGVDVRDGTSGYRAFRRAVLEEIGLAELRSDGYSFQLETLLRTWRAGFVIDEVPITFVERRAGQSKISRAIVLEALWRVLRWGVTGPRHPDGRHPRSVLA